MQQEKDAASCLANHEDKGAGIAQNNRDAAREFSRRAQEFLLSQCRELILSLGYVRQYHLCNSSH